MAASGTLSACTFTSPAFSYNQEAAGAASALAADGFSRMSPFAIPFRRGWPQDRRQTFIGSPRCSAFPHRPQNTSQLDNEGGTKQCFCHRWTKSPPKKTHARQKTCLRSVTCAGWDPVPPVLMNVSVKAFPLKLPAALRPDNAQNRSRCVAAKNFQSADRGD